MLIIFDLDDTLVATSASITPVKRKDALQVMIDLGLRVYNFEEALLRLQAIDATSLSFKESLLLYGEEIGASQEQIEAGLFEFYHNISPDLPLTPLPGALDLLAILSQEHTLALVSKGEKEQQMRKLEKAGIDTRWFSTISIVQEGSKLQEYRAIITALGYPPEEVIVCGDRIAFDLSPAKILGATTVHIRQGRGRMTSGNSQDVDASIDQLFELLNVVQKRMTS